jgi:small subunit ribosomal protein S9
VSDQMNTVPPAPGTPAPEAAGAPPVESTPVSPAGILAAVTMPGLAPAEQPAPQRGLQKGGYFWGTGRRKTAVARVRIKSGSGKFLVEKQEVEKYFFDLRHRMDVVAPLKATKTAGKYDIFVHVRGGGQTGQAGAIVLGLARALLQADSSHEEVLRDNRFLTRDARKVERKKPGQPGARKRFQFSKR